MRRDAYHAKRNKHGRGEAAKVIRGRGDLSAVGTSRHLVRCSRCPELRVNRAEFSITSPIGPALTFVSQRFLCNGTHNIDI
jgi:hypothetical protein